MNHPSLEGKLSLEEWMREALEAGQSDLVVKLLKTIPAEKREKYREIWKRVKNGEGGKNGSSKH